MATDQEHFEAARRWQEHFQTALNDVGGTIPSPTLGQSVTSYRREMCRRIKRSYLPQNHEFYKINWRGLPADVLDGLGPQLLEAAKAEAYNPATVKPGSFRQITKRDPYGNVQQVELIGPQSFVKQMGRAGRRIAAEAPMSRDAPVVDRCAYRRNPLTAVGGCL